MPRASVALLAVALAGASSPLEDGIAALRAGRLADAERSLAEAVRTQPASFDANYYLGLARFQLGRPADARRTLEAAVETAPDRAAAWRLLGMAIAATGDIKGALAPFRKACALAPGEEDSCYYLGRNQYSLNLFEPARIALEKALAVDPEPKLWRDHRALAQVFEALGMPEQAEKHFREAIRRDRGYARADQNPRLDLGGFLFRQGRAKDSLPVFAEAAGRFPESGRAQAEWGRALLQLGRTEDAAGRLEKAVRIEPENWSAHLLLGRAYQRLGRHTDAEEHLRRGEKGLAASGYGADAVR